MNFSESAFNKLMISFPELGKHVIAFRDMKGDMDENSTTDIGVFIIKSGGNHFYVPVISKSGTIYPIDSMFNATQKKFFPLTKKTLGVILDSIKVGIGKPAKIPKTVNVNPSVRELVEPPKTGKYSYASEGRIPEFLHTIPDSMKSALLEKISSDIVLTNELSSIYDIKSIVEPLQKRASIPAITVGASCPIKVVTEGVGLPEKNIQEILENGYSIMGTQGKHRVAIASDPDSYSKDFTYLSAAVPGSAYDVVYKNGTTRSAIVPKTIASREGTTNIRSSHALISPVIFDNGDYSYKSDSSGKIVIRAQEIQYKDVLKSLLEMQGASLIGDILPNTKYIIFDGPTLVDIFYVSKVTMNDGFMDISGRSELHSTPGGIQVNKGMKGNGFIEGNMAFLNEDTIIIPTNTHIMEDSLETNLTAACKRQEFKDAHLLEGAMAISHSAGNFSAERHPIGNKVDMLKLLIVKKKIQPAAAEDFIKRAENSGYVNILMSKQAAYSRGSTPAQIPEFGEKLDADPPISGTRQDRMAGLSAHSVKSAIKTKDKQIVDATILSELLNDPDLQDTISSYLPEIEESIDKIGRILLVTRMNAEKLTEKMDSIGLTDLLTSLRNTYRAVGENYIKLERLSRNASNTI